MSIDRKLVLRVADLANLNLTDDEVARHQEQLSKILDHIAQIDEMTDDLGAHWRGDVLGGATPERPDVARPSLDPENALANAPKTTGTAFQVPRIIE